MSIREAGELLWSSSTIRSVICPCSLAAGPDHSPPVTYIPSVKDDAIHTKCGKSDTPAEFFGLYTRGIKRILKKAFGGDRIHSPKATPT